MIYCSKDVPTRVAIDEPCDCHILAEQGYSSSDKRDTNNRALLMKILDRIAKEI